jgi:hypothetical protein
LSGVVLENTDVQRPLAASTVAYAVEGGAFGTVTSDANGRYSITNIPLGRRVRLVGFAPWQLRESLFQPCASLTVPTTDSVINIELVSNSAAAMRCGSPTVSGTVYRATPDGRKPLANTPVVYKSFDGPWYDAYGSTDGDGRYNFGRLALGTGQVGAGNCNDQMLFVPIRVDGDTLLDIDITPLLDTCPGVAF